METPLGIHKHRKSYNCHAQHNTTATYRPLLAMSIKRATIIATKNNTLHNASPPPPPPHMAHLTALTYRDRIYCDAWSHNGCAEQPWEAAQCLIRTGISFQFKVQNTDSRKPRSGAQRIVQAANNNVARHKRTKRTVSRTTNHNLTVE